MFGAETGSRYCKKLGKRKYGKKEIKLNKIHYFLLVLVLIIGIIIRFWALGDKSLWIDECIPICYLLKKAC